MSLVQLANDLVVKAVAAGTGFYGVEASQPVAMEAEAVLKVSGVIQEKSSGSFTIGAVVQGSNDLSTWHEITSVTDLIGSPNAAPWPFVLSVPSAGPIEAPYAYIRVVWLLIPTSTLAGTERAILTAYLSTGRKA